MESGATIACVVVFFLLILFLCGGVGWYNHRTYKQCKQSFKQQQSTPAEEGQGKYAKSCKGWPCHKWGQLCLVSRDTPGSTWYTDKGYVCCRKGRDSRGVRIKEWTKLADDYTEAAARWIYPGPAPKYTCDAWTEDGNKALRLSM